MLFINLLGFKEGEVKKLGLNLTLELTVSLLTGVTAFSGKINPLDYNVDNPCFAKRKGKAGPSIRWKVF